MNGIRFIKRNEIDEQKWNALIRVSQQSLPYAFSWYLDAVAEHWDALVLGDYEAVMPLVWMRKLGIKCLYQPYYCQQLGFFSKKALPVGVAKEFLVLTNQKFPYLNINLNPSAQVIAEGFSLSKKKNLLLNLSPQYPKLKEKYSENHRRNIAKGVKAGLQFSDSIALKIFQRFYLENVNRSKENFKAKHEKIFKAITKELVANGTGKIFAALNNNAEPVAATLFIFHQGRVIGIINTSSADGKKAGGSHFLFDQVIKMLAGTEAVLDFEGSSIPTIARFYQGFGAYEEAFYNYSHTIIKSLKQRFA